MSLMFLHYFIFYVGEKFFALGLLSESCDEGSEIRDKF